MNKLCRIVYRAWTSTQLALTTILVKVLFGSTRPPQSPQRILLLRTGGLGDFLLAIPAMRLVRRAHPNAKIMLVTVQSTLRRHAPRIAAYAGGTRELPWLRFVVGKHVDRAIAFGSGLSLAELMKELLRSIRPEVRAFAPDLAIVLPSPLEKSSSIAKKLLFFKLVGFSTGPVLGWKPIALTLFRRHHAAWGLAKHRVWGPVYAVSAILPGYVEDPDIVDFDLNVDVDSVSWVDDFLKRSIGTKIPTVFAPGSILEHKNWPLERYVELGRRIVAHDPNVVVIVVGPPNDRQLGARLVDGIGERCINLAGELSLQRLAALLARAKVAVGNDGGAMHLASAMRSPCVTLGNGINDIGSIEPWFSQETFLFTPVSCAPCYSELSCPSAHNRCVKDIPVDAVFAKVASILGNPRH